LFFGGGGAGGAPGLAAAALGAAAASQAGDVGTAKNPLVITTAEPSLMSQIARLVR
jgi:hypothetical protein